MPITATCDIEGVSPLSWSRHYRVELLAQEGPDQYEQRTWRERLHCTADGEVFLPPMAFKIALSEFARYRGIKVPGQRGKTYASYFDSSVLCLEPALLGISRDDVIGEWVFVPSDGRKGGSKRVDKCFPVIPAGWRASVSMVILDRTIDEETFRDHFSGAGTFIGIGRFRPKNGGYYGRFALRKLTWLDDQK